VVLAIALVAAFLVSRQQHVADVPANQNQIVDSHVKAYQEMIKSDYAALAGTNTTRCNSIDDTGCEVAAKKVVNSLQLWIDHLDSYRTPPQVAVVDGHLRRHLAATAADWHAAVAFQKTNNERGFILAMNAARYERTWLDPMRLALAGDYGKLANSYEEAFSTSKQVVGLCATGRVNGISCEKLARHPSCLGANADLWLTYVQDTEMLMQTLLFMFMQNPPPADQVTKTTKLETYLAQVDEALLAITDALLKSDEAKLDAALQSFAGGLLHASYTS
jgi:hypothetical protein